MMKVNKKGIMINIVYNQKNKLENYRKIKIDYF